MRSEAAFSSIVESSNKLASLRISARALCILTLLAALFEQAVACADEAPPAAPAAAAPVCGELLSLDEAMKQGIKLREPKTVESNRKAYALFSCIYNATKGSSDLMATHSEALVQLYKVEMVLGMWVEAREHIKEAQLRSDDYINKEIVHETMSSDFELIKRYVGSVQILAIDDKSHEPLTGSVLANGRPLSSLPMNKPIDLSVGSVQFEITSPGYHEDKPSLTILSGRLVRYESKLARIKLYEKWQFWVGIGCGAAVVITGVGLGLYYGLKDRPERDIILQF